MKIDFLTPMVGKPNSEPALLHGTDIYEEPIRFLNYLIKNPQQAEALLMVLEDTMPHLIKTAWDDLK